MSVYSMTRSPCTEYIAQYDLYSNGITRPRIHVDVWRVHVHVTWATCSRVYTTPTCALSRLMKATPRTPSSLQCQIGIANASQKKSEVGESHRAIAGDRSGNRRRRKSPTKSRGRRGRKVVGQKGPWPAAASPGRCHGSFARRRRRGGGTPLAGVVSACLSLSRSLFVRRGPCSRLEPAALAQAAAGREP